jgi:hypothetical protein
VSCGALEQLVKACSQLRTLVLPPTLQLAPLLAALRPLGVSYCLEVPKEEEEGQQPQQQQRQTLHLGTR